MSAARSVNSRKCFMILSLSALVSALTVGVTLRGRIRLTNSTSSTKDECSLYGTE